MLCSASTRRIGDEEPYDHNDDSGDDDDDDGNGDKRNTLLNVF
jgi:hypothetical protein